jgi:5-methylcytosine-specific restriction protein A
MEIKTIKRPWQKQSNYGNRYNKDPLYHSQQWRSTRDIHLEGFTTIDGKKVSNRLCIECYKKGKVMKMHTVDHIIRVEDGGPKFDLSNLQSLCLSCHNRKSAIEGNQSRS